MYIYVIMKTMCPPGYHHNGLVETHTLGHNRTSYIYIYIYIYILEQPYIIYILEQVKDI